MAAATPSATALPALEPSHVAPRSGSLELVEPGDIMNSITSLAIYLDNARNSALTIFP